MSEQENNTYNERPTLRLSLPMLKLLDQMLDVSKRDDLQNCAVLAKVIVHYAYTQELVYMNYVNDFPQPVKCVFDALIHEIDMQKASYGKNQTKSVKRHKGGQAGNQNARKKNE